MIGRSTVGLLVLLVAALGAATAHAARGDAELQTRVERLENLMQSQGLMEMLAQVQQLQREVRQLRGEVELQGHTLEQLQQRQRDLYVDIDRRLQQLEAGRPGGSTAAPLTPAPVATPAPSASVQTPAPQAAQPAVADSEAERVAYEQALNILREGRYPEAATAYRQFLATYPNGRYADNAQYWLGETQYVTRQFQAGLDEFGKVLNQFPNSPKVADAQLKIGYIHYEMGNWKAARENLEAVVNQHPGSTAARLASERLARMTREKR